MNIAELFVRTLEDLHRSINSEDEYEVIRSSGIIRMLFLDSGDSLVDQVNRKHGLKLEFEIIDQPFIPEQPVPELFCAIDSIDPRRMPSGVHPVKKTRGEFFGLAIGSLKGTKYSIRDTVKFVANVLGGVHAGSPNDKDKQKTLNEIGKIFIFSNKSVLLQQLRSIGRIILETLKPLRYRVLKLERFENAPGISIHMALSLLPDEQEKELYILDLGTDPGRNRLSIYVDTRQDLTFRAIDSNGHRTFVRAGSADCAYHPGVLGYFVFEAGILSEEILLTVEAGGWSTVVILRNRDIKLNSTSMPFVLGSDLKGVSETHMTLTEHLVYERCLKDDERRQLRGYFENKIRQGYKSCVYFKGRQFLTSAGHPNFPEVGSD
jgi:hypothetical protein